MKTKISNLPQSKIELTIEISVEEFEKFRKEAIFELGKQLKIDGFRSGHIPEEIIGKSLSSEKIIMEAAEKAVSENYKKAVSENNIFPLGQPEIKILKMVPGNPFEFKATVFVMPEIKLPDYKKISSETKRKEVSVQEKEIESSLSWLQKSRAKFSLKQGPVQKGDFIEIEYSSSQIENNKTYKDAFITGEGHFLPGFEDNLIGLSSGQEKTFLLKFPADHSQKALSGKDINFKVKLSIVQKMELPEINDEFVKGLGAFETLSALKESIKEGIILEKENLETERIRKEILGKVAKNSEFELPEILVEAERNRILEDLKNRVSKQLQIPFENYLSNIGKSEKDLLDSFKDQAKEKVENGLVLREIGKREDINVSENEIKEEMNRIMKRFPNAKSAEKEFDPEDLKEYTEEVMRNEKTFKLLESFIKKP